MNERYPIPQEIIDLLPEGCRDCPVALFTLQGIIAFQDTLGEDPADTARNIADKCDGYQGDEPPLKVTEAEGRPVVMTAALTDENCAYSQTILDRRR